MLLHDYWLTLAIALFLPALAWIEARADLPALRQVALAVAALVLVRLVLNWYVLDYAFGTRRWPTGCWLPMRFPPPPSPLPRVMFRRRGDDLLVATLEAGAVAFLALLRRAGNPPMGRRRPARAPRSASRNRAAPADDWPSRRRPIFTWPRAPAGRAELGLADPWWLGLTAAVAVLVLNPMVTGASAGVLAWRAAYLAPAASLFWPADESLSPQTSPSSLGAYAVVAGFAWITLQIRQIFHPGAMGLSGAPIEEAELWAWSGAMAGLRHRPDGPGHPRRRAAASPDRAGRHRPGLRQGVPGRHGGLTGLWRVLSFLGLGLALIGLGVVYRRFVLPTQRGHGGAAAASGDIVDEPPVP